MDDIQQPQQKNNSAYYAFLYIISLITLGWLAISSGIIIFQLINKYIPDAISGYRNCYDSSAIRFAIASIIVASPIYYISTWKINKHLRAGELQKESNIRKWLSYLIILVSSVVIIGSLIAVIFGFLEGELTSRFLLKIVTMLVISGTVLSYYFYDIKREIITGEKDKVLKIYFIFSLIVSIAILILAMFFVESPFNARNKKIDDKTVQNMSQTKNSIDTFVSNSDRLPNTLEELKNSRYYYPKSETIENIDYKIISKEKYKLCADFKTSSEDDDCRSFYYNEQWQHKKGYQCIEKTVNIENEKVGNDIFIGEPNPPLDNKK